METNPSFHNDFFHGFLRSTRWTGCPSNRYNNSIWRFPRLGTRSLYRSIYFCRTNYCRLLPSYLGSNNASRSPFGKLRQIPSRISRSKKPWNRNSRKTRAPRNIRRRNSHPRNTGVNISVSHSATTHILDYYTTGLLNTLYSSSEILLRFQKTTKDKNHRKNLMIQNS